MYTVINKLFFRLLSNQNNFFQSLGIANIWISMQSGHESIIFVFSEEWIFMGNILDTGVTLFDVSY